LKSRSRAATASVIDSGTPGLAKRSSTSSGMPSQASATRVRSSGSA
jgi:hypothetical protein